MGSATAAAAQAAASIAASSGVASSPLSPVTPHADRIMLPTSSVLATDATSAPQAAQVPTMCASWASIDECIIGTEDGQVLSLHLPQEVGSDDVPVHHEYESASFVGSLISSFLGAAASGCDPVLAVAVVGSHLKHALVVHVSGTVRLWNTQSRSLARETHLQRLVATSSVDGLVWVDGQSLQHAQVWPVDIGAAGSAVLQWCAGDSQWTPPVRLAVLAGAGDGTASLNMVSLSSAALTRGSFASLVRGAAGPHTEALEAAFSNSTSENETLAETLMGFDHVQGTRLLDVALVRSGNRRSPSFALLWQRQQGAADGAALVSSNDDDHTCVWMDSSMDTFSGLTMAANAYEDGAVLGQAAGMARSAAQAVAARLTEELGGELYAERDVNMASVPQLGSFVGAVPSVVVGKGGVKAAALPPSPCTAPAEYSNQSTVPVAAEVQRALHSSHVFAAAHASVGNAAVPSLPYPPAVQVPWLVALPRKWRADAVTACKCQIVTAADTIDFAMLQQLRLSLPLQPGQQGLMSLLPPKPASAARFTALQMLTAAAAMSDAFGLAPFTVQLELPSSIASTATLGGSRKAFLQACQSAAESALAASKAATAGNADHYADEDVQVVTVQLADVLLADGQPDDTAPVAPQFRQPCPWAQGHPLVKSMLSSMCMGDIARMLLSAVHGATASLYPERFDAFRQDFGDDLLQRAATALPSARSQAWACAMHALRSVHAVHSAAWGLASDQRCLHLVSPLSTLTQTPQAAVQDPALQSCITMFHCVSPGMAASLQAQSLVPEQLPAAIGQAAARWEPHILQCAASMPSWEPLTEQEEQFDVGPVSTGDAAFAVGAMLATAAAAAAFASSPHDFYVAHAARVANLCASADSQSVVSIPTAEHHPLVFAAQHPLQATWVLFGLSPPNVPCALPQDTQAWTARAGPAVPPLWLAAIACSGNMRLAAAHVAASLVEVLRPVLEGLNAVSVLMRQVREATATGLMGWASDHSARAEVFTSHDLADEFAAGPAGDDDGEDMDLAGSSAVCSVLGLASTSVEITVGTNVAAAAASAYSQWVQGELALCVDAAAEGGALPDAMETAQPCSAEAGMQLTQLLQQEAASAITYQLAVAMAVTTVSGSSWMQGAPEGQSGLSCSELLHLAADESSVVSLQPLYAALCADEATARQQQAAVSDVVARHSSVLAAINPVPQHGLQLAASVAFTESYLAPDALMELYGITNEPPMIPLQAVAGAAAPLAVLLQLGRQAVAFHTPLDVAGCVQDADALVAMLGHAVAATGSAGTALLRSSSLAYATGNAQPAARGDALRLTSSAATAGSSGMSKLQAQAWSSSHPSLMCGSGGHAGSSIMDAWGVVHSRLNVARHPVGLQLLPLANDAASDVAPLASGQSIFMPVVDGQQFNADGSRLQRHVVVLLDGSLAVRAADRRVTTPRSPADCVVVGDVEVLVRDAVEDAFTGSIDYTATHSFANRERQSLWHCGSNEALAEWSVGQSIDLNCTDGSIVLAAVRAELWGSNAASASQQLRRGDRMWLPKTASASKPNPQAWQSVCQAANNALPGTAVLCEGASVLQAVLLSAQVGITAAAGSLLLASDADSTISRRLRENAVQGLITGAGAENAFLGTLPAVHQARAAVCMQPSAPGNTQALVAAAMGILAPPLHGSSVTVFQSEPQHDVEAESAPSPSLEAAPLPSSPLGSYATLTPALHITACLRQYHAVWNLAGAIACPASEPQALYSVAEKLGQALQAEQRRQHAFASAASSTAVLDSLASAGAHLAATALVHTFSAQLLHACLPAALYTDEAQQQVLTAQMEPEENDGVLDVLQETRGFADLQDALGCMYHPPDDLHGVPETIVALTVGAGVSETASRHKHVSRDASAPESSTRQVLEHLQEVADDLRDSNAAPSRQASGAASRAGVPMLGQSSDADQRLSQLAAYGWRLRAAHLYAVSQLLQTVARPFAEIAKQQSQGLDDYRLYTLSASDRLQPLSAALVCMRCVCNEKAQARAKLYFLRDIDQSEGGATRPSHAFGAAAEGLELSALPAGAQEDGDGDWVPPPPAQDTSLSLSRSQSAVVAQAQYEESQREKVIRFTRKLAEDKGAVGRLSASDSSSVVDDDVALLVSISSRQVDLALDACEFKLAVAAAAAQPMPDAASYTLQSLAARLLEHFRVREFVSLDAAPRIWGVILESIAWRARTCPVPLCIGGAHFKPHESCVYEGTAQDPAIDLVPSESSAQVRPGSFTQQVLAGAKQVDVNAYSVLASVASTQQRWADAAGWYYALAYRQAAAAANVVRDLHGLGDGQLQVAIKLLVHKLSKSGTGPSMRSSEAKQVAYAASTLSVLVALLTCRSTALDAAVACLACLPAEEAFLVTVDTEDRIDWVSTKAIAQQQPQRAQAMQSILAHDVEVEAALARGQTLLLQTALTAEAHATLGDDDAALSAVRDSGVLGLFPQHVLTPQVHWGALKQVPAARSAVVSAVCISQQLWLACATRQRETLWTADGGAPPSSFMHLQQGDDCGHGVALVTESMRLASAGRSSVPSQSVPGTPGVVGMPLAPVQLALCEVGAYDLSATLAALAAEHRQAVVALQLPVPTGQRAEPVHMSLAEVVRHGTRRAVDLEAKAPQLPGMPSAALSQEATVGQLVKSLVLTHDGPHLQWQAAVAVIDESLLAAGGSCPAPQWAVDLGVWGSCAVPASFEAQCLSAKETGAVPCGNPLAVLNVLWNHGQAEAAAFVAACCLPSPLSDDCSPLALLQSVAAAAAGSAASPAALITACNRHAPTPIPLAAFEMVLAAARGSEAAGELEDKLAFYKQSVVASQQLIMSEALSEAQRDAQAQHAASRRSKRAGAASNAAMQRAQHRDAVRAAADGQVLGLALQQHAAQHQDGGEKWQEMVQELHGPFAPVTDPVAAAIAAALDDDTEQEADLGGAF